MFGRAIWDKNPSASTLCIETNLLTAGNYKTADN